MIQNPFAIRLAFCLIAQLEISQLFRNLAVKNLSSNKTYFQLFSHLQSDPVQVNWDRKVVCEKNFNHFARMFK